MINDFIDKAENEIRLTEKQTTLLKILRERKIIVNLEIDISLLELEIQRFNRIYKSSLVEYSYKYGRLETIKFTRGKNE